MATEESGISIVPPKQGELKIGRIIHGGALNCMIIPAANPDDWFMKQFFSQEQVESYAMEFNLTITRDGNE